MSSVCLVGLLTAAKGYSILFFPWLVERSFFPESSPCLLGVSGLEVSLDATRFGRALLSRCFQDLSRQHGTSLRWELDGALLDPLLMNVRS